MEWDNTRIRLQVSFVFKCVAFACFINYLRPGKIDLQFIVRAFLKCMRAGGHFSFFIISFGPVHVATETII